MSLAKIIAIEPSGQLYGSEYCLLDLLRGFKQTYNWEIILPQGGGFDEILERDGFPCHYTLPRNLGAQSKLAKLKAYGKTGWTILRQKPDLIYLNQAGMLRAANKVADHCQVPIVCQVQTLEDARFLSKIPEAGRHVKAFICNSEFIANETDIEAEKKCVFYQGLEQARLDIALRSKVRTLPPQGEPIRVGLLGRIAESKGHFLLVNAAKQIIESSGERNWQFVIIGDAATTAEREEFEAAIESNGLKNYFDLRGYCQDLATELAPLHLLTIPSPAEPLGRVLFDAAEAGLPAIVSDTGGLGEICQRYQVGVSFKGKDPSALANAIEQAVANYDAVQQTFREQSSKMLESLSMDSYLNAFNTVLDQAIKGQTCSKRWFGSGQVVSAAN